ncbi:M15 family metallopeptidase [Chitinimonas sp.]|uniref:M15 family metallopeptidase n=1 Tax=Chitinimonas sp. TaxID=1934313 RepID=UPI002F927817
MPQYIIPCEAIAQHPDFRSLASIAGLQVDLRYAGPDNFVGRPLYTGFDGAWLHREAAAGLATAVTWLAQHRPGLTLLVLDALRPHRVQIMLWEHLEGTGLRMYLADPARGSIHSFGKAVDVTLLDATGQELDMGTGFDDLSERSHPALEDQLLAAGQLTAAQLANRHLLRETMLQAGFAGIRSEWWHFNHGDQELVRRQYGRVD